MRVRFNEPAAAGDLDFPGREQQPMSSKSLRDAGCYFVGKAAFDRICPQGRDHVEVSLRGNDRRVGVVRRCLQCGDL